MKLLTILYMRKAIKQAVSRCLLGTTFERKKAKRKSSFFIRSARDWPIARHLTLVCTMLLSLMATIPVLADGSKDLYPNGIQGHRAMLSSSNAQPSASFPFPNQGIHYVYAQAGEIITLASNSQDPSGTKRIYLYSPSGVDVTPTIGAAGNIPNRAAELAGPAKPGAGAVGNQYVPLYYTVPTTGIYQVSFRGGNSHSTTAGLANGDWSSGTSTTNVSAWDVSVFKPDDDEFVAGRVWTNV